MSPPLVVAALFAGFALLHSVTVSEKFKVLVGAVLGEGWMRRWYRAGFTVLSTVTAVAATYFALRQEETLLLRPAWPVRLVFHFVQFFGLWLVIAAAKRVGFGYFLGVNQLHGHEEEPVAALDSEGCPRELYTTGIYGLVRHPMYLGGILAFLPEPNIGVNCLVLRTLATAYFMYGAVMEERRCARLYGKEYLDYREHVPMFNIVAGIIRAYKRQR